MQSCAVVYARMAAARDKTVIDSEQLFGLAYWPPLPAFLISTASPEGRPHVAPFSLVTFSSYVGVAEDPTTPRIVSLIIGDYDEFEGVLRSTTYRNIRATGEFAVNVPTEELADKVDRLGAPSDDKFAAAGVTAGPSTAIRAPVVSECPVNFECRLEAIDNRRWLGEIIHGRVVATQVDPALAERPPGERMRRAKPLYHHGWSHEGGTYYRLGDVLREETEQ
jgi:flavin reductase (DIM6/NTAB) family NADH-FMN oxidoreductase RutF